MGRKISEPLRSAGQDRDNRGKVFLYCNPHDQVIGVSPVQGIGWRGVGGWETQQVEGEGVLYQRVWAAAADHRQPAPLRVGAPEWTNQLCHYRRHNHDPKQFWYPLPPLVSYDVTAADPGQNFVNEILTLVTAPLIRVVFAVARSRLNDDPPDDWTARINAPALRVPLAARPIRYDIDGDFDEGQDFAWDALARHDNADRLENGRFDMADPADGWGNVHTETHRRYEQNARLRANGERKTGSADGASASGSRTGWTRARTPPTTRPS